MPEKMKSNKKLQFAKTVLFFYLLMMVLYGYFVFAAVSSAPAFIYSGF